MNFWDVLHISCIVINILLSFHKFCGPRGLSLQQMLDYIQELDEAEDDNELTDLPTAIYIEPPIDGNISGEDDAEEECDGVPDNVFEGELK